MKQCANCFALVVVAAFMFARVAVAQTTRASARASAAAEAKTESIIQTFPIPVGQKGRGIRFPYTEDGKLKMFFNVDGMQRDDLEHVTMTKAKIITYNDDQKSDITLLLPVSVFDLRTRLLTTDQPFVLKRADLELIGDALELDTLNRQAKITGKVNVIIYNFQEPAKQGAAHE